ncbi:hypothetical protein AOLI_G00188710 [Acnodon oligacanthus]
MKSKSSSDRIYDFSAVTLLNERQIDIYNSTNANRTARQDWLKELQEKGKSEWKEGIDKLNSDGQQLNKVLDNQMKAFKHNESAQMHVYVFATQTGTDSKLNLTCLATGFYPKDVKMIVKKFNASLPEHLLKSSGVRPNEDGTYQLRKSVEIKEDEAADYVCYVNHSSINTLVTKRWGGTRNDEADNRSGENSSMLPGNSSDDQPKMENGQSSRVEDETRC